MSGWENAPAAGGGFKVFDSILAAPAASFGPAGGIPIPGGFRLVKLYYSGPRVSQSPGGFVTLASCGIQINGDAGANYLWHSLLDSGLNLGFSATGQNNTPVNTGGPQGGPVGSPSYAGSNNLPGGFNAGADSGLCRINLPGANCGAGSVGMAECEFPNYDNALLPKQGIITHGCLDPTTFTPARQRCTQVYWNNVAPITALDMVNVGGNFGIGSRFTILAF